MQIRKFILFMKALVGAALFLTGCSSSTETISRENFTGISLDTVKAQRFDMGKMWTFENPPVKYFKEEYNFSPDSIWFEKAQKSALKFGNGCSASFISEDGLIMTNHHCVRGIVNKVARGDENFLRDGFFAGSADAERRIPGLFVQQLLLVKDVTGEIQDEMLKGTDNKEKIQLRDSKKLEIINRQKGINDSLIYEIVSLYNGGRYSLYGYKRFDDIRLVCVPDLRTAKPGGDYDNFTYPRHGLDCAFLRAYENNLPVKSPYYFKWNIEGAQEGEPIFVVGNPGSTSRIKTIDQIEYDRDIFYPVYVDYLEEVYSAYFDEVNKTNAEDYNLIAKLYTIGNSLKVFKGTYEGLKDPVMMKRKSDFENKFRTSVNDNPSLKKKYSDIWDEIKDIREKAKAYSSELSAYSLPSIFSSEYFNIAGNIIKLANGLSIPEESREPQYKKEKLDSTKASIFPPNFSYLIQKKILTAQIKFLYGRLGTESLILNNLVGGRKGKEAADYLLGKSKITSPESLKVFLEQSPGQILNSGDPFIDFVLASQKRYKELKETNASIDAQEEIDNQLLGKALFEVYGETIPPDATGTLRIADGVIQSYSYNGTIAPTHTTFYGLLEKYFSFNKKFPFNLSPVWENIPKEFDLSAPLDFISTNDIIGGNSGSPVINKNLELIGLAFDGNYESLPAKYIYTTEKNRTISVHPKGMIEAIRDLYKFNRLSDEILQGKISGK